MLSSGWFSIKYSEESVYGDQGQEVAREVWEDRFNARREQEEIEEHEIAQSVRGRRWRREQGAKRIVSSSERFEQEQKFELQAKCDKGSFS